ncbi:MAG: carboxylesterase family protein [Mesoflavibacter sp.]|nr:carboxylesterase family protein [Mesoflavibacter sp.]
MQASAVLLLSVVLVALASNWCHGQSPTVRTQYGNVRGRRYYTRYEPIRKAVDVFLGVPYAQTPTGNLRFAV